MAKFSAFSRESKYIPDDHINKAQVVEDKYYFTVQTMNNTDNFELSAVMLRVARAKDELEKLDESDKTRRAEISSEINRSVISGIKPIVTKYATLHNLFDNDGKPITVEDLCEYPVFQEAVIGLMNFMIEKSTPGESDEKN